MPKIKRVYDEYDKSDGFRILVDRLWPRGVSKENAHLDLWLKDIAPSNDLRKWFGHDPKKWEEFKERYKDEIRDKKEILNQLKSLMEEHETITLVYGAKDTEYNEAVVLKNLLAN